MGRAPVEAAGAPQRTVERVDAVGGADDDYPAARVQAVHQRQQRGHDGVVDLVLLAAPHLQAQEQLRSTSLGMCKPLPIRSVFLGNANAEDTL